MDQNKWEAVIGLEIHAQIQTNTKMFSPDKSFFSAEANTHIHPVSLGFPGTLPVLNKKTIEQAVLTGRAFHCEIQKRSIFARKHYFYPDLPKGYQISQFTFPLLQGGFVEFYSENQPCKVSLERIHIEEDAGRLLHEKQSSSVDFNRAGVSLLEIVSRPEITSPAEAANFARTVRLILIDLKISDGNLQEGSMRFDCNISLKPKGQTRLGTKVELKNLNSFRFIEKALNFEIKRQTRVLNEGGSIHQETRLFNPKKNETFSMRAKESSSDYRYFPDPDLLPLVFESLTADFTIQRPFEKTRSLVDEQKIPLPQALILVEEAELYNYFQEALKHTPHSQTLSKWIINEVLFFTKETKTPLKKIPILPRELGALVNEVENKTLSSKMAKNLFSKMWETGLSASVLIKKLNLKRMDDKESLNKITDQILKEFPQQCGQYRQGKTAVYKFLMGQIMKLSKGQADPEKAGALLKEKLKK